MTEEELFEKLITSEVYEDTLLAMTIMPKKWKNFTYIDAYNWKRQKNVKIYTALLNYYVDHDNIYRKKIERMLIRFGDDKILL